MNNLAFVFPGQGSQSLGMLSDVAGEFTALESVFNEASERLGFDLWRLIQEGPEVELNKTENTQPALLAASVAMWRIWKQSGGGIPACMAGHSLGEYTALVCAGVFDFSDAIALVAERGRTMQQAVPEGSGAMAAILGLEDEKVIAVCQRVSNGQTVSAANFNSPGQVVIAGHRQAVQQAMDAARQAGAKRAVMLPVSVPSHCALMQAASDQFTEYLEQTRFSDASIPVIHNVDAEQHTASIEIKQALLRQLHQPVRWVDTILTMRTRGITRILECGPGRVLTGLVKRIDRSLESMPINDCPSLKAALPAGEQ
ncbi:MAG: ACP S-malonyltransferase [Gammaproteobacteria bacterium]